MSSWSVFSPGMARPKPHVTTADIKAAMVSYSEKTCKAAKLVALHPKYAGLALPEGLERRLIGGVLGWECWLSDSEPMPDSPQVATRGLARGLKAPAIDGLGVTEMPAREYLPPPILSRTGRGRRATNLPLERIAALAAKGLSCREIAGELEKDSIFTSYRTIARVTSGQAVMAI